MSYTYAPYIDMTLYVNPTLTDLAEASGANTLTLSFIQSSGQDKIGWGGQMDLSETDVLPNNVNVKEQIEDLREAGGDVIISFGGASGTPAAAAATDAETLQSMYQMVVDRYTATSLDFDVEGSWVTDTASISLRNEALAGLQADNPDLEISFTVAVTPDGLTQDGLNLLVSAEEAGVDIDVVNIMAMDYGPDYQGDMAEYAMSATDALVDQLADAGIDAKVGVTPMIGVNDVAGEVFTLDNAYTLTEYLASNDNVARVGIWSTTRDNGDGAGDTTASAIYSGVAQESYEFSKILSGQQTAETLIEEVAEEQEYYFGLLDPDEQYHYGLLDPDEEYHYGLLDPDEENQAEVLDATASVTEQGLLTGLSEESGLLAAAG